MVSDSTSASDHNDLRTSLMALSRLATGQMELEDVLTRVAEFAVSEAMHLTFRTS